MKRLKVLAIAAATGRVGYVFMFGDQLKDWGLSRKASKSEVLVAEQTQKWINLLKPDAVVTEKLPNRSHKGSKSRGLIAAIARTAEHNYLLDISVTKLKQYKDKYVEAKVLAERYPDLQLWLPKPRKFYEPEPRNTIYFEALALALQAINRPTKGS